VTRSPPAALFEAPRRGRAIWLAVANPGAANVRALRRVPGSSVMSDGAALTLMASRAHEPPARCRAPETLFPRCTALRAPPRAIRAMKRLAVVAAAHSQRYPASGSTNQDMER
jgi:hypothetical protein